MPTRSSALALRCGHFEGAIDAFNEAIRLNPEDVSTYHGLLYWAFFTLDVLSVNPGTTRTPLVEDVADSGKTVDDIRHVDDLVHRGVGEPEHIIGDVVAFLHAASWQKAAGTREGVMCASSLLRKEERQHVSLI